MANSNQPHKKRKLNNKSSPFNFNVKDFEIHEAVEGETDEEYENEIDDDINHMTFEDHKRQTQSLYNKRVVTKNTNPLITARAHNKPYNPINNILDEMKQANTNNISPKPTKKRRKMPSSTIKHSNLWLLPCKTGTEEYSVQKLLENKDKYEFHPSKKLFISDAFINDINNGYIYVEADKKFHVELACKDIKCLKANKIKLVPFNERGSVLRMRDNVTIKNTSVSDNDSDVLSNFILGEKVKVIHGALINLNGIITLIKDNNITIKPDNKALDEMVFLSNELLKVFDIGCFVKVIDGKYKNANGNIIKMDLDKNKALIFNRVQSKNMYVDINDMTEVTVNTQPIKCIFELYDLVEFGMDKVGVIITIKCDKIKILDVKEQINVCRINDVFLNKSRSKNTVAFDSNNNEIHIGDIVIPHFGNFKYKNVIVKQIYRSILFCYSNLCHINAGIFVIKSKHCIICGGQSNELNSISSNRKKIKKRVMGNKWMSKQVKITKGFYKGMVGVVCGGMDKKLQVELHCKNKTIKVACVDVRIVDQTQRKGNYGNRSNNMQRNDRFVNRGDNTPAYNASASTTPIYENNDESVWHPCHNYF